MGKKINDYAEVIRIYNDDGVTEAFSYMRSQYGIKYPKEVIKRLKNEPAYHYDADSDKFMDTDSAPMDVDSVFMSLDELCAKHKELTPSVTSNDISMDVVIKNLIEDRLLQLSKYVQISQANKQVFIDRTSLMADGYTVNIH